MIGKWKRLKNTACNYCEICDSNLIVDLEYYRGKNHFWSASYQDILAWVPLKSQSLNKAKIEAIEMLRKTVMERVISGNEILSALEFSSQDGE